jgi:peptidoglycan-associated lipoprotein
VVEPKKQQPLAIVPAPVIIPNFSDIYFDFDKSLIRKDAVPQLENVADWMTANPTKTIAVEAHADAKGTSPYNIALGQRRADAAKDYLVKQGVDPSRIKAVSYGKEKPFVTSSNEQAKNRRIHFVVE